MPLFSLDRAVGLDYACTMKIVELTNVVQRDTPVLYRRTFTATAALARGDSEPQTKRIEFTLEHLPLGPVDVAVKLLDEIDYPLVPTIAALKEHIQEMEREGELR